LPVETATIANEKTRLEGAPPAQAHAAPQRFIVYLVDDLNTKFSDMTAVRSAMSRHLGGLAGADSAAIDTFSGRAEVDFTSDKDKLEAAVAKLRASLGDISGNEAKECPNVD
jgi:hypothetical protein